MRQEKGDTLGIQPKAFNACLIMRKAHPSYMNLISPHLASFVFVSLACREPRALAELHPTTPRRAGEIPLDLDQTHPPKPPHHEPHETTTKPPQKPIYTPAKPNCPPTQGGEEEVNMPLP